MKIENKIAVWGIVIPAVISLIGIVISMKLTSDTVVKVQNDIQPILNMQTQVESIVNLEPKIINVNNNIIKVEKSIAGLYETISQMDALKKTVSYHKNDLGKKVRIVSPSEDADPNIAHFLLIELDEIPYKNSVSVFSQNKSYDGSSTILEKNIIIKPFLGKPKILIKNTDWISVKYTPDNSKKESLYTLDGFSYDYNDPLKFINLNYKEEVEHLIK